MFTCILSVKCAKNEFCFLIIARSGARATPEWRSQSKFIFNSRAPIDRYCAGNLAVGNVLPWPPSWLFTSPHLDLQIHRSLAAFWPKPPILSYSPWPRRESPQFSCPYSMTSYLRARIWNSTYTSRNSYGSFSSFVCQRIQYDCYTTSTTIEILTVASSSFESTSRLPLLRTWRVPWRSLKTLVYSLSSCKLSFCPG
jgi:hypothetical protein